MSYESKVAERAVIGSILVRNSLFGELAAVIDHRHFAFGEYARLWAACEALYRRGEAIDHITLAAELGGEIGAVGGHLGLSALTDDVTTTANAADWAKTVKAAAVSRWFSELCAETNAAIARGEQFEEILRSHQDKLFQIAIDRENQQFVTFDDSMADRLNELASGAPNAQTIPTGFGALDRATSGLTRGLLHVVGGRPGMGKSALLLNMGCNLAISGKSVLFFSLEDSASIQRDRAIARFSGVDLQSIISNKVSEAELSRIMQASAILSGIDCRFYDGVGDADSISRMTIAEHTRRPVDVIIVDHLGYALGAGTPYEASSAAIRTFARLAKQTRAAVVVACQLNRQILSQSDKRPQQKDLRDSGRIEEDARQIWFVHREAAYDDSANENELELVVAKASHGRTGIARLFCDLAKMYISDPGAETEY